MLKFRPRYSLRNLLVVVTLLPLGCWLFVRQREFSHRAEQHEASAVNLENPILFPMSCGSVRSGHWSPVEDREIEKQQAIFDAEAKVHRVLGAKYQHAAKFPWLPVEPDPPGVKFQMTMLRLWRSHGLVLDPLPNPEHAAQVRE